MKRTFIAVKVEPGDNLVKLIGSLRDDLKSEQIRWVDPHNLHLTLAFLGDTVEADISKVTNMLKENCPGSGKLRFTIEGVGIFRNLSDPRVLWAGISNEKGLTELHVNIKRGLLRAGIDIGERSFSPHLTLGRIKSVRDKDQLEKTIIACRSMVFQDVVIDRVIYYESVLNSSGPSYFTLGEFSL